MEKVLPRKHVDSDAFRIEYSPQVNERVLRKDVESYLGEYLFKLSQDTYHLMYSGGQLMAPYDNESMIEKGMRAVQSRKNEGRNTSREEAELKGLFLLEKQLENARMGHAVLWASPPGPKEEGYGDYGLIFMGQVQETGEGDKKRINMTTYRVEKPKLGQFNEFIEALTGNSPYFETPEEFLASPQVIEVGNKAVAELMLNRIFRFTNDKMRETSYIKTLHKLSPHIDRFTSMIRAGESKDQLIEIFNSIQNYALDQTASYDISFEDMRKTYNYEPPKVAGSCGRSGSIGIGSMLRGTSLEEALSGKIDQSSHYEDYQCPHCNKTLSGEKKGDRESWRKECDYCHGKVGC